MCSLFFIFFLFRYSNIYNCLCMCTPYWSIIVIIMGWSGKEYKKQKTNYEYTLEIDFLSLFYNNSNVFVSIWVKKTWTCPKPMNKIRNELIYRRFIFFVFKRIMQFAISGYKMTFGKIKNKTLSARNFNDNETKQFLFFFINRCNANQRTDDRTI